MASAGFAIELPDPCYRLPSVQDSRQEAKTRIASALLDKIYEPEGVRLEHTVQKYCQTKEDIISHMILGV